MLGRDKVIPAATEEPRLEQRECLLAQGLPAVLLSGAHLFPALPQKFPSFPFLPCHKLLIVLYHGSNK